MQQDPAGGVNPIKACDDGVLDVHDTNHEMKLLTLSRRIAPLSGASKVEAKTWRKVDLSYGGIVSGSHRYLRASSDLVVNGKMHVVTVSGNIDPFPKSCPMFVEELVM